MVGMEERVARLQDDSPESGVMAIEIEKEWAAVRGDEIFEKAETREELEEKIDTEKYEIIALPKNPPPKLI